MADKIQIERTFVMNSTDNYIIGETGQRGGTWTIHLQAVSGTRSAVVKARAKGSSKTFVAIPYTPLHLNGAASDGVPVSTAITTDSLIQVVVADGMDVSLDNTNTSGSISVTAQPSS